MAQPALDAGLITSFFGVQPNDIETLITTPSTDSIAAFLRIATGKAKEFEQLKASKLQLDVELETSTRQADARLKAQKSTAQRQAKEIEDLRNRLNHAESSREQLSSNLSNLQHDASGTTAETEALRQKLQHLESTNRSSLAAIDRQTSEKDAAFKELQEKHGELIILRAEVRKLEQENASLHEQTRTLTQKEQMLRRELDLSNKNNEYLSNELSLKATEYTQFRKERNLALNTAQRELEDAIVAADTLRQSEQSLRRRLEELQEQADKAFARNADLQETAARAEQSFRAELDSTRRLADLHAQNAATHKARAEDVHLQVDQIRDDAAAEIGRLQTEIETERADKRQAEATVAELELQLENQVHRTSSSIPGTPNGNASAMIIPGSAQKMVRNLTNTHLYSQFIEAKQDLEIEERRNAKLQSALDEMITEMESRAPELLELRQEQDRLESEVLEFSRMLDEANEIRETAVKEAQRWQTENAGSVREGDILRQQLRDLSAQVKILLVELQMKERGLEDMSVQERLELERAAHGDIEYTNNTSRLISERIVLFRDVHELQERNTQLLRLTRELGDKMEGEEALEKQRQSAAEALENTKLRAQIQCYQDEMSATTTQIDSYMKERDMFRRMLQHRGTLPADADTQAMFGNSIMPATPQRNGLQPTTPRSQDVEDLAKLLKEHQKSFDEYRTESSQDRLILRNQVDALAQEKSALQLDFARSQASLQLSQDRFEVLQGNFKSLTNENAQLQKRSQQLSETAAKQDTRTLQAMEDSVEAQSTIASLRAENANIKAEKDLWKRTEGRLLEDNKSLVDERTRISKLNSDMSSLMNERERAENDARRRLQGRIETLESQLSEKQQKLETELENNKNAILRREYEETQNRTRVDDLMKSLSNAREELAAARTIKDQLQGRVHELKIELKAAEEKASIFRPRAINGSAAAADAELTEEQRLAVRLSDAQCELGLATTELTSVRGQVEEYKRIAQTAEDELASLGETAEQYREENDKIIAEKNAQIEELEKRIDDITSELQSTNQELSDLRMQHDDASRDLRLGNQQLQASVKQLQDDAALHTEEKTALREDVIAQAEIATQAQQNYDSELVKHADATRALQVARQKLNGMRTDIARIRAEAEAAKLTLENSQESWSAQRDALEREIEELKQRRIDMDAQNKRLHEQLDTFSTQLDSLRQAPVAGNDEADDTVAVASATNLQEIIRSLRRDKDIVEVQQELATQESRRLSQQLEYANRQVDELRAKLADERKQSSDRAITEASTSKLADTINELNLYRESSITLRNEAKQAKERYEEKSKDLERLRAELEPLQAKVAELEADVEVKDSEIQLITADRDHWRERSNNVLAKYDRVDPAEIEEMKARIATLEDEKQLLEAAQEPLQAQIADAEARMAEKEIAYTKAREAMVNQAKEKSRAQVARITELRNELTTAQSEQARLASALDAATAAAAATSTTDAGDSAVLIEEAASLRGQLAEADAQASVRTVEVAELQAQIAEHEQQVATLQHDLARAQASIAAGSDGEVAVDNSALLQAQKDLADAKQQITLLQASSGVEEGETTDLDAAIARVKSELEQQHQEAVNKAEEAANARIAKLKANLQRQLVEGRMQLQDEARADLITKHNAEIQTMQTAHDQLVEALKSDHAAQMEALRQNGPQAPVPSTPTADTSAAEPDLTDDQINALVRNNQRVRTIMSNSVRKTVAKETDVFKQSISDKDAEIAALKEKEAAKEPAVKQENAGDIETLRANLERAQTDKDDAVRLAIETAEKKFKVQLSSRDMAIAKNNFVQNAAKETPQRPVVEVWEEAKKARPAPKSAAPARAPVPGPTSATPTSDPVASDDAASEGAKLKARAERFGNSDTDTVTPNPEAPSFVPGTSGIPTSATRGGRGGIQTGRGSYAIQGAAARGSGIARGRGNTNAGIKRQHEGGGGGDGKRARGGGSA